MSVCMFIFYVLFQFLRLVAENVEFQDLLQNALPLSLEELQLHMCDNVSILYRYLPRG